MIYDEAKAEVFAALLPRPYTCWIFRRNHEAALWIVNRVEGNVVWYIYEQKYPDGIIPRIGLGTIGTVSWFNLRCAHEIMPLHNYTGDQVFR